jgi:ketosteroid isomerase-like protein
MQQPPLAPALARALDAFTRGAPAEALTAFAADALYREPRKTPLRGRDAIAAHFARFAAAGTDWRFTVDDVIAQGGKACVIYRFAMSEGPGKPVRERAGCATVRLDGSELIAEWREYET